MNDTTILLALCLVLAAVSIAGGLWVLAKQKIVVDESGSPTSIDIPFFGKIQTNYPSLVAIFVGGLIAYFSIDKIPAIEQTTVQLTANVSLTGTESRHVFVHAVPEGYAKTITSNGNMPSASVQFELDGKYRYDILAYTMEASSNGFFYNVINQPDAETVDAEKRVFVLNF